jgi:pyrrolidone-carboxylate peptidase
MRTIVNFLTFLILGMLLPCLARGETLLITAFEPFEGHSANNSARIAKIIAKAHNQLGVDVSVCILPVVYDQAALSAESCFEKMKTKPDYVVSLGEGGVCGPELETRAMNQDNDLGKDNAGTIRQGSIIDPKGPKDIAFDFPLETMYCALTNDERTDVTVANNMAGGDFVCNNTAYHLSEYFRQWNSSNDPSNHVYYTFIHVPAGSCTDTDPTKNTAQLIIKMLKSSIAQLRVNAYQQPGMLNPSCTEDPVPFDSSSLNGIEKVLLKEGIPTCEQDFFKQLDTDYKWLK